MPSVMNDIRSQALEARWFAVEFKHKMTLKTGSVSRFLENKQENYHALRSSND